MTTYAGRWSKFSILNEATGEWEEVREVQELKSGGLLIVGMDVGVKHYRLDRGPDPAEMTRLMVEEKPSHKLTTLERLRQGREAKRDMLRRSRK